MAVSTSGDWNRWLRFFTTGIAASARGIGEQLTQLLGVQPELKHRIRDAGIKADSAMRLVDFAVAKPIFTARRMERRLGVTYTRANSLVGQLEEIGVLHQRERKRPREYAAPDLLAILVREPY